jgi:membrane protease YdiL (CAAX protease family)
MGEPNDPLSPAPPPVSSRPSQDLLPSRLFYGPNGLRAGWRLLMFLAILSALFSVTAMALRLMSHRGMPKAGITPEAALFGEGIPFLFVLIASWIMARIEGRTIADYGLPRQGVFGTNFWQGVTIGFTSISALLGAMRLDGAFHLTGLALHGVEILKYAALWAVVFVVVGFFEELLFRGYLLFTLATGVGFWPAAFVSSAVFGYVHHGNSGENWVGAFAAGLVGLVFCLLLRRTGDLWMPIGFHAAWDWGETYFYGVPDSGQGAPGHLLNADFSGPQWLTGGTVGPEGSYLCIGLLVLLWFIFIAWLREAKYPNPAAIAEPRLAVEAMGISASDKFAGPHAG